MSLPFTSVVSYHANEYGCGVAKFSKELAQRLGVPFHGLSEPWGKFPLLSLKWGECRREFLLPPGHPPFGLFWHDAGHPLLTTYAAAVFYADPSLGAPGLWCPSLLPEVPKRTVKLFTFGMAGRLQAEHFRRVRQLLERASIR